MNMKRWVSILIGVTIIAFGIGIFSLIYYDDIGSNNIFKNGIIRVKSNNDNVTIIKDGIIVKNQDSNVKIGWDGIDVRDGNERVTIGWGGITVKEGGETKFSLGNPIRWGNNYLDKLHYSIVDEEKNISIENVNSIVIGSEFIDVKIFAVDRADILVKYYGEMKSDVVPKLNIIKVAKRVLINLENPNSYYTVKESDVVLEIFVPKEYENDISATTTSADIKVDEILAKEIKLASVSGDVEVEKCVGSYDIRTTSGDVDLDIEEDGGDIKIEAVSGDVSIKLYYEPNYKIKAKTTSGDVKSNFYIPVEIDKSNFDFQIGDGRYQMNIETISGDIKINK